MKSVATFIELFQGLNYKLSEKKLSSSGTISLSKREIFGINASLNDLTVSTPVISSQLETIRVCIGDLCNYIYYEDEYEERISYFLIHLHLNQFMRHHFCDLIKSLWPILVKVNTQVRDLALLHKLIEDSLSNTPCWNWLSSAILAKIATNDFTVTLLKEVLNSRENLAKFERMKYLNRDFTSLMNLIELLVTLEMDTAFLPGLTTPYIKYIETINPHFKNLIQCLIESNIDELASLYCYAQPIDRYLLHVWVESEQEFLCHHINLKCLKSFRTFPNLIVKLNLSCVMGPKTRSKRMPPETFITSFAVRLSNGSDEKSLNIQLQMKDVLHFNWLVQYLKSLQKKRKLAVNTVLESEIPHISKTSVVDEKARLQSFEARRSKSVYQTVGHNSNSSNKRKKLSDEWDLTLDCESSFDKTGTFNLKQVLNRLHKQGSNILQTGEISKGLLEENEVGANNNRKEKSEENTAWTSEDREHGNVSRHRPAHLDASYRLTLQEVDGAGSSTNLFVPTDSSKLGQSESLLIVLAPKERISRVVKTQASLILDTQAPVRTSTPINAEFTEFPTTTDKTSDTEGTIDVMQDALRLFSSNLVNKLKRIEFEVLHRRNDLQALVDDEYNKIEHMQRAKLKEIQEYCKSELDKIV